MAKNWKINEVANAIKAGNIEDIQDLGRRFPLVLTAIAGGDFEKIVNAIPDHISARKVEQMLKGDVETTEDETVEETKETKVEEPAKKERKPRKKAEPEVEEDVEEEDPVALYKECKKAGLKVKARQSAEYYKEQLAKANEVEDDEDDWGDEEEETPKKPAKKAAKKPAKKVEEPEDDDEDDDDWDI